MKIKIFAFIQCLIVFCGIFYFSFALMTMNLRSNEWRYLYGKSGEIIGWQSGEIYGDAIKGVIDLDNTGMVTSATCVKKDGNWYIGIVTAPK